MITTNAKHPDTRLLVVLLGLQPLHSRLVSDLNSPASLTCPVTSRRICSDLSTARERTAKSYQCLLSDGAAMGVRVSTSEHGQMRQSVAIISPSKITGD